MNEKLLNKIKALLAKGSDKGVTEEESKAFLGKAAELMAKHGLEMSDLPADAPERSISIGEDNVHSSRKREYDSACGSVLEKCFDVKILHSGGSSGYWMCMIGTAEDVALAKEILPMLRTTMSRGFLQWQRSKGITKWQSAEARAFYWGLARGYIEASEEGKARAFAVASKEQKEAYGLILVNKQQAIGDFLAIKYPNLRQLKGLPTGSSNGAGQAGYQQGATLKLIQPKKIR